MIFPDVTSRSQELERLDTGDFSSAEFELWQREMRYVHGFAGELRAVRRHLIGSVSGRPISVLDVGAGSGQLLTSLIRGIGPAFFVGAEPNFDGATAMRERSIPAVMCDGLRLPFPDDSFDHVISTLVLHHLSDANAVDLLGEMRRVASRGIIVVDLHRTRAAYLGFKAVARLVFQEFTREDGALSILRGFTPGELAGLASRAGLEDFKVHRSALFRLVLTGK